MVVAAPSRDEREAIGDGAHRGHGLLVEGAVKDLEPTQAALAQLAHEVEPERRFAEMGERRQPARRADRVDRFDRADAAPADVAGAAITDEADERVLHARCEARADQGPPDGRPAERRIL